MSVATKNMIKSMQGPQVRGAISQRFVAFLSCRGFSLILD
jgi:hypothetical protein